MLLSANDGQFVAITDITITDFVWENISSKSLWSIWIWKILQIYRKSNLRISTRIYDTMHKASQLFTLMKKKDCVRKTIFQSICFKFLHRRLLYHPYKKPWKHKSNKKSDSLYGNRVSVRRIHFYDECIGKGSKMLKSKRQIQPQCSPSPGNHQKWCKRNEITRTRVNSAKNHFTCNE